MDEFDNEYVSIARISNWNADRRFTQTKAVRSNESINIANDE